jgi:hypothetical protein
VKIKDDLNFLLGFYEFKLNILLDDVSKNHIDIAPKIP